MESMYHPSPLYGAYRACINVASMTDKRLLVVTRHDVSMMERLKMSAPQVECYRRIEFKVGKTKSRAVRYKSRMYIRPVISESVNASCLAQK